MVIYTNKYICLIDMLLAVLLMRVGHTNTHTHIHTHTYKYTNTHTHTH